MHFPSLKYPYISSRLLYIYYRPNKIRVFSSRAQWRAYGLVASMKGRDYAAVSLTPMRPAQTSRYCLMASTTKNDETLVGSGRNKPVCWSVISVRLSRSEIILYEESKRHGPLLLLWCSVREGCTWESAAQDQPVQALE